MLRSQIMGILFWGFIDYDWTQYRIIHTGQYSQSHFYVLGHSKVLKSNRFNFFQTKWKLSFEYIYHIFWLYGSLYTTKVLTTFEHFSKEAKMVFT